MNSTMEQHPQKDNETNMPVNGSEKGESDDNQEGTRGVPATTTTKNLWKQKALGICLRVLVVSVLLLLLMVIYAAPITTHYGIDLYGYTMGWHGCYDDECFSKMSDTMFTLFRILTLDGWSDIARQVSYGKDSQGPWFAFASFIIIGVFLAVPCLIVLLCDSVVSTEAHHLKEQLSIVNQQHDALETTLDGMAKLLQEAPEATTNDGNKEDKRSKPVPQALWKKKALQILIRVFIVSLALLLVFLVYAGAWTSKYGDLYETGFTSEDYFSGMDKTMFTLFQLLTLDNWADVALEIRWATGGGSFAFVFFVMITSFLAVPVLMVLLCDAVVVAETGQLQEELSSVQKQQKDLQAKLDHMTKMLQDALSVNEEPVACSTQEDKA